MCVQISRSLEHLLKAVFLVAERLLITLPVYSTMTNMDILSEDECDGLILCLQSQGGKEKEPDSKICMCVYTYRN